MTHAVRLALAALALAGAAAACSSTQSGKPVSEAGTTATTATSTSTTSSAPLQVTVPDCGAGAYRPATLLIVCASGGTMATDIQWTSWSSAGAGGVGTVHVQRGTGRANLALDEVVVSGAAGPQFTRLTINWIGASPDGHPFESFHLENSS